MTRRLLLVRHARIANGNAGRLIGASDPGLDPCGRAQLQALAEHVRRLKPDCCYCSPLQRCRQTAVALVPGMPTEFDDRLREIDFGRWENRTFEEVAGEEPALVARWGAFAEDFAFPGGESLAGFCRRVQEAARHLAGLEHQTVLAVTHGGVIRTMLCHLLGLEPRKYVAFDVGYAALAVIDLFDGRGVLAALERTDVGEAGHG